MIVLTIPISKDVSFDSQSREANPYLYVTYQSIYTYFAYPSAIQMFEVSFPATLRNKYIRKYILPIPIFIITTSIYILYSPIVPTISTDRDYARTLGPFILSWYAAFVFILVVYSKMCYESVLSDKTHSGSIRMKTVPMMTMMTVIIQT